MEQPKPQRNSITIDVEDLKPKKSKENRIVTGSSSESQSDSEDSIDQNNEMINQRRQN